MHEFYKFIAGRRSVRKYRKVRVSHEQLVRILEAGKWAPSAHNAQPWHFFILQTPEDKEKLAKAMGGAFRRDLAADGEAPELIEDLVEASIERFSSAPVLILACLTMKPMDSYPDEKRRQAEFLMAVQSVATALNIILLAAHAEGLASCWFCAPLFCPETVQESMGLADEFKPQALISLGKADETPDPPVRHPLKEFVTFGRGLEE